MQLVRRADEDLRHGVFGLRNGRGPVRFTNKVVGYDERTFDQLTAL
jgi:hypothetical protein